MRLWLFKAPTINIFTLEDDRIPYIAGSTMKVIELVTSHLTYGWSPEELHFQYPHISLSRIHSALAYYWDHKIELDIDIQRRLEFSMQQKSAAKSPIAAKLRAAKSL